MKRLVSICLCISLLLTLVPLSYADTTYNNCYNEYNNYYYINDEEFDYVDLYSANNSDPTAFYRPKYEDLLIDLEQNLQLQYRDKKINRNGFDADYSNIDKSDKPTSRGLEILGYDYLLYKDSVNPAERIRVDGQPVTAPQLIMDMYKALNKELYDVYFEYQKNQSKFMAYISRTNVDNYWKMFMNDHPVDYLVYNDYNVDSASSIKLTGEDAIIIIAQMLDFYGEPVISKKEEYILLQHYGNDVPVGLSAQGIEAWSYLKCRGIIGQRELDYSQDLSFNDMIDLLMRVKDKDSRFNFKEVGITTDLSQEYVDAGYYESNVQIDTQPYTEPVAVEYDYASATRYDYLIEVNDSIMFKSSTTGTPNKGIFISKGYNANSDPIPGSVYHGLVDNKYYHFSVPINNVTDTEPLYINSTKSTDYPLNYMLPTAAGGVYTSYTDENGCIKYTQVISFNGVNADISYVDLDRRRSGYMEVSAQTQAANMRFTVTDAIDIDATKNAVTQKGYTFTLSDNKKEFVIRVPKYNNNSKYMVQSLIKYKSNVYTSDSKGVNAILSLTGDNLLVPVSTLKKLGIIKGYDFIPQNSTLVLYSNDRGLTVVDNEHHVIQKGSLYLQIKETQSLYTKRNGEFYVDFRAVYGTNKGVFQLSRSNGSVKVTVFESATIKNKETLAGDSLNGTNLGTIVRNTNGVGKYVSTFIKHRIAYKDNGEYWPVGKQINVLYDPKTKEYFLPFASANPLSNYILYGEYDGITASEKYYLVVFHNPEASTGKPYKIERELDSMFWCYPTNVKDHYSYSVFQIDASKTTTIKDIHGIGYCFKLDTLTESNVNNYWNNYRNQSKLMPYAILKPTSGSPYLLNFNRNYYAKNSYDSVGNVFTGDWSMAKLAPVGVPAWFTIPEVRVGLQDFKSVKESVNKGTSYVYLGTERIVNKNGKLVTQHTNKDWTNSNAIKQILGVNYVLPSPSAGFSYTSPNFYSILLTDLAITLSSTKQDDSEDLLKLDLEAIRDFFKNFEDITLLDFVKVMDNYLSIAYYLLTRAIPLIIMSLIVIIMILAAVSDIKIVQLFSDKVLDLVKLLTLGRYNIYTIRQRNIFIGLIIALALMGIIQNGVLEKIIVWILDWYFTISDRFIS